jgi:hypothetical protein
MFGRLAIEPDKSADETWQPAVDLQRPERCFVNARRKKDALKAPLGRSASTARFA